MKKLLVVLLLVLVVVNVYAKPIGSTAPITPGAYVDRYTDRAYVFTATSVSYVEWPSRAVIWTVSDAPFFINLVNWVERYPNGSGGYTYTGRTLNYFEFVTPKNSPIPSFFPGARTQIALRFVPVTRNAQAWIDVYYMPKLLDPLGCGYAPLTVFFKSCVKQ